MKKFLLTVGWCMAGLLMFVRLDGQEYHVERYGPEQGLSDKDVSDVHKDKFGYLWVATSHGLNLYNGLNFRVFRYNPEDSLSIRANSLERLYEDPESNIWVTLSVGGVNKYDRFNERFQYYTYDPLNGSDPNNFVQDLLVDSQLRTWVATNTHINLINENTGRYEPVPIEGHEELHVYRIFEDREKVLWLGSDAGLFRYDTEKQYFAEVLDANGQKIKEAMRFVQDHEGKLWITSSYSIYRKDSEQILPVTRPSGRFITNLFTDENGRVHISQYEDNLYVWNENEWQIPPGFVPPEGGLRFGHAMQGLGLSLVVDNEGNFFVFDQRKESMGKLFYADEQIQSFGAGVCSDELWLGSTHKGLYKIDLRPKSANHVLPRPESDKPGNRYANYVSSIAPIDDQKAIITAGSRLFMFNMADQTKDRLKSADIKEIERKGIRTIKKLSDDEVLLTSDQSFYKLNWRSLKVTKLDFLSESNTYDFLVDNDSLWTIGSYGLAMHNLQSGTSLYFNQLDYLPLGLRGSNVRAVFIDRQGIIWVGNVREGLFRVAFDKNSGKFVVNNYRYAGERTEEFKSQTINTILEDRTGRLWIGGFSSGLMEFDREKELFINHNPENELPIPNVQAMVEAEDGAIWVSALNGIHRYDPDTGAFDKFTSQDGLSSAAFAYRSAASLKSGPLAFGTDKGLTIFKNPSVLPIQPDREVLLERLQIQNDGTSIHLPETDQEYRLQHNQNFLSFDFISLNYHNADRVSYQYRLKGLEEGWNTGKNRQVQYANLKPGSYTFETRGGMDGGNWSEESTVFSFVILKPFWWQTWFLALVALMILSVIYAFYRFKLNLKLSKVRALETIRQNAAADFHDEMGNKLTRISLFTEVLEKKLNGTSPEIKSYVNKIKDNSHILNNSMRDFLWALDPEKDTTFDLIVLLKDFGDELFDNSDIQFHVASIKEIFREYPLDMDWKRHLVMIFKEAMHNALKYSEARKVTLKASLSREVLNLSLSDDGKGFKVTEEHSGYGQANMKRRAEQLGASISIESAEGKGTVVTFIGTLTKKYETYD